VMAASRRIEDLHPRVQKLAESLTSACAKAGIDILIYATLRDNATQDALYAQGRKTPGAIVTNARGGESLHNYGMAFDCVPLVGGKADWNSKSWPEIGRIGEAIGLTWAGRWTGKLRETAHFQFDGGISVSQLKEGKRLA
jgi:peptidoglycan L-alanyl-D-glutamate endopeptidase CwlK